MAKALNIRLYKDAKRNHKVVGVECFHNFLNLPVTIISDKWQPPKHFVEVIMISAYTWNVIPVDGIDIGRSISIIVRPLRFPMDIALAEVPQPADDASHVTVIYIRKTPHDTSFAKDIVLCLTKNVGNVAVNVFKVLVL